MPPRSVTEVLLDLVLRADSRSAARAVPATRCGSSRLSCIISSSPASISALSERSVATSFAPRSAGPPTSSASARTTCSIATSANGSSTRSSTKRSASDRSNRCCTRPTRSPTSSSTATRRSTWNATGRPGAGGHQLHGRSASFAHHPANRGARPGVAWTKPARWWTARLAGRQPRIGAITFAPGGSTTAPGVDSPVRRAADPGWRTWSPRKLDPARDAELPCRGCPSPRSTSWCRAAPVRARLTLLNVLSSYIPADDRVVTIEDAGRRNVKMQQKHVGRLETRPANVEGIRRA